MNNNSRCAHDEGVEERAPEAVEGKRRRTGLAPDALRELHGMNDVVRRINHRRYDAPRGRRLVLRVGDACAQKWQEDLENHAVRHD